MSVLQFIVPSEVTPILVGLDMLREFGLVIYADSAHCYSTKLRCRILVTVLPSGVGPCSDTISKLQDNGEDKDVGRNNGSFKWLPKTSLKGRLPIRQ